MQAWRHPAEKCVNFGNGSASRVWAENGMFGGLPFASFAKFADESGTHYETIAVWLIRFRAGRPAVIQSTLG